MFQMMQTQRRLAFQLSQNSFDAKLSLLIPLLIDYYSLPADASCQIMQHIILTPPSPIKSECCRRNFCLKSRKTNLVCCNFLEAAKYARYVWAYTHAALEGVAELIRVWRTLRRKFPCQGHLKPWENFAIQAFVATLSNQVFRCMLLP